MHMKHSLMTIKWYFAFSQWILSMCQPPLRLSYFIYILDVPIPINIGITFSTTTPRGRHVSKKLDVKTSPFHSSTRGHWCLGPDLNAFFFHIWVRKAPIYCFSLFPTHQLRNSHLDEMGPIVWTWDRITIGYFWVRYRFTYMNKIA